MKIYIVVESEAYEPEVYHGYFLREEAAVECQKTVLRGRKNNMNWAIDIYEEEVQE